MHGVFLKLGVTAAAAASIATVAAPAAQAATYKTYVASFWSSNAEDQCKARGLIDEVLKVAVSYQCDVQYRVIHGGVTQTGYDLWEWQVR